MNQYSYELDAFEAGLCANDLHSMGLLTDADLEELNAPWPDEVESDLPLAA